MFTRKVDGVVKAIETASGFNYLQSMHAGYHRRRRSRHYQEHHHYCRYHHRRYRNQHQQNKRIISKINTVTFTFLFYIHVFFLLSPFPYSSSSSSLLRHVHYHHWCERIPFYLLTCSVFALFSVAAHLRSSEAVSWLSLVVKLVFKLRWRSRRPMMVSKLPEMVATWSGVSSSSFLARMSAPL